MESHKKYIDVQYMIDGEELIGHSFLQEQVPSKAYSDEDDYMLFSGTPSFFSAFQKGMFAIFYPTDLHMPGIAKGQASIVKKAVIKVRID